MSTRIVINSLALDLLAEKAVYIPKYHLLVIADWHLGKMNHFRKEGLFMPLGHPSEEFNALTALLNQHEVRQLVFLGDLFHSHWNAAWNLFEAYIKQFPHIRFLLTKGNHDILSEAHFQAAHLDVIPYYELSEGIILSHEPLAELPEGKVNMVGHLHPGCIVRGKGRQSFRLPCFYQMEQTFILPAFGKFTGLHILPRSDSHKVYAIVNDVVILLGQ